MRGGGRGEGGQDRVGMFRQAEWNAGMSDVWVLGPVMWNAGMSDVWVLGPVKWIAWMSDSVGVRTSKVEFWDE